MTEWERRRLMRLLAGWRAHVLSRQREIAYAQEDRARAGQQR